MICTVCKGRDFTCYVDTITQQVNVVCKECGYQHRIKYEKLGELTK